MADSRMTRRVFLKTGGAVIVGIGLGGLPGRGALPQTIPTADAFLGKTVAAARP